MAASISGMVYFYYIFWTYLALLTARGIWMRRQARKEIREWLRARNEVAIEMSEEAVFGPHYDSVWKAAMALLLHYCVKVRASDGTETDQMFSIDFVPLIGSFRELRRWGDNKTEEETTDPADTHYGNDS